MPTLEELAAMPVTANESLLQQLAKQRASNPRTDVTDLFGYGPDWKSYWKNAAEHSKAWLPQESDTVEQKVSKILGNMGLAGLTVYHGSPHKFSKFDLSKVGTGEGAQAYGHGLYFAENPKVARGYQESVTIKKNAAKWNAIDMAEKLLKESGGDFDKAIASIGRSAARDVLVEGKRAGKLPKHSFLYKAEISDEAVGKMLDWDKPISQQAEHIKKAISELMEFHQPSGMVVDADRATKYARFDADITGAQARQLLEMKLGDEGATKALRDAGIPGIKYLDQGSRTGGKGTYNFVVFDDQLPKIIGKE